MKKLLLLVTFYSAIAFQGFSQTFFVSQPTGGAWNVGTTWDQTACASECVAGVDYPGPNDVAVILVNAGAFVSFPRVGSPSFSCKDLFVVNNVANSIRTTGISGTPVLNISGQLSGALDDLSDLAEPTVNVFHTTATNLNLIFSGSNLDDPFAGAVITSWGFNSPIYRASFNAGSGNTLRVDNFAIRSSATIQSGTFELNTGQEIHDFTGTSVFTVSAGTTLNTFGSINGGTASSLFGTITINGAANTGGASHLNANTFNLGTAATLNVGFNGVNQTQGWWYQSNSPSLPTLNATSTVNYNANTVQNVAAAVTYGNLTLTSSSAAVKTLSGSGLIITGNLAVGANVTSSPSSQVQFSGSAVQSISGAGTLNFDGGLTIDKTGGTITLNKSVTISGGLTVSNGTFVLAAASTISGGITTVSGGTLNLGDVSTTLAGGSFANNGITTSGTSGTLTVTGASTFSGGGSLTLNNLTIGAAGAATINNSAWSISGNITNNGAITLPSSSTVTFNNGLGQTISGNAFSIGNMVVDKPSSTLSNNANVELTGVLTVSTGTFDADGSGSGIFTLNSDTNGDAAIGAMAGGSIVGEVTFERYFNNTSNRWRNLSFPVSSVTYAELGSSLALGSNSLATYTEATLGNVDQGWNIVSGGTLNSMRGHTAWMYNIQPITISVRGPLLQQFPALSGSPYNFGVTYTNDPAQLATEDGWNFVPNPFASPINWNNSGWVKTNVNAAAAVWDVESNTYRYTNVDWDGVVAQGQAFWVQTNNASPALTCMESVKVTNSDPTFYRRSGDEISSKLLISLKSGVRTDKAMVQFRDDSTPEFDGEFDAYKLKNGIYNLSTVTGDGVSLAANVLPKSVCTSAIKVNITDIEQGTYTFSFEGLGSFTNLNSLSLQDKFTKNVERITENGSYSFEVTSDPKSFGADRFELIFDFMDQKPNPLIQEERGQLVSNYEEGNQWYLNGQPIEGATGKHFAPNHTGVYFVSVLDGACLLKSETKTILDISSRVFPNPATTVLKVDVGGLLPSASTGDILLHSSQGQLMRSDKFTDQDTMKEINILDLRPGTYILKLISNNGIILVNSKVIIK